MRLETTFALVFKDDLCVFAAHKSRLATSVPFPLSFGSKLTHPNLHKRQRLGKETSFEASANSARVLFQPINQSDAFNAKTGLSPPKPNVS